MTRPGRKPKPTALKLLRGNPGKRKLNAHEPKPSEASLDPPEWLCDVARETWNRLAPLLANAGLLTEADVQTLARYCDMTARWHAARKWYERMEREEGGLGFPITDKDGKVRCYQTWPETTEYHRLAKAMLQIEQEFGFTPSARSRVVSPKKHTAQDSFEAFLLKRQA